LQFTRSFSTGDIPLDPARRHRKRAGLSPWRTRAVAVFWLVDEPEVVARSSWPRTVGACVCALLSHRTVIGTVVTAPSY